MEVSPAVLIPMFSEKIVTCPKPDKTVHSNAMHTREYFFIIVKIN